MSDIGQDDRFDKQFQSVTEQLRANRRQLTALERDRVKQRARAQAERSGGSLLPEHGGIRMKHGGIRMNLTRRPALTAALVVGLMAAGTGATIALPGEFSSDGGSAASKQYTPPGQTRSLGAPGRYCQAVGAEPGSDSFKSCVRLAAKARGQARNGDKSGGDPNRPAGGMPGKYCQTNGAAPGSEAFRDCVPTAKKAKRAAKG